MKLFFDLWQLLVKEYTFTYHDDTHEKVNTKMRHDAHEYLKVVKFVGFTGSSKEIELLLNLVEIAVSLETIIIDVRLPYPYWVWKDDFSLPQIDFAQNEHAEKCRKFAHELKTQIRPHIDVVTT